MPRKYDTNKDASLTFVSGTPRYQHIQLTYFADVDFFLGGGISFVNFSIHPPRKLTWKHKQNEGLEVVQDSVYSFSFGRKGRCLRISMFIFRGKLSRLAITKFRSKRDHPRSTLSSILYAWKGPLTSWRDQSLTPPDVMKIILLLMEELRRSPVEVGSLSMFVHYLQGFRTIQPVVVNGISEASTGNFS